MTEEDQKWYHVDLELLRIKGFYFFTFAAIGCLFPYISLYMKVIGLSQSQTGIIFGIMPFIAFIIQPAVGYVNDKFQKHKICLIMSCVCTAVLFNLIPYIPSSYTTFTKVRTSIMCEPFESYISDCEVYSNNSFQNGACPLSFHDYYRIVSKRSQLHQENNDTINCDLKCHKKEDNVSVRKSHKICFGNKEDLHGLHRCHNLSQDLNNRDYINFRISNFHLSSNNTIKQLSKGDNESCSEFDMDVFEIGTDRYAMLHCPLNMTMICDLVCTPVESCITTQPDKLSTSSFVLFVALLLLGNIGYVPIFSLFDAISYDLLGSEKRNKWGQQRLWGNVSLALFAVISAVLMDALKFENSIKHFNIAYYMYGALFLIMAAILCNAKISNELYCGNVFKGAINIVRDSKVRFFLIVVTYLGMLSGGIEAFLFWFLEAELNNKLTIIPGLCMLSNCVGEIIFFYFSGYIIKRIGHFKCIYIAFIAHFIRLTSYSFLTHAWYVLPVELLNGVPFSLMWAAATSYSSLMAPRGMSGTMQGALNGLYFGLGKGVGSLVTGELYTVIGIRWTFRSYGIISLAFLVVYMIVNTIFVNSKAESRKEVIFLKEENKIQRHLRDIQSEEEIVFPLNNKDGEQQN